MKSTGITRKIDDLGRLVIPAELRRVLNIKENDMMEFYVEDDKVVVKKYKSAMECAITGKVSDDNMVLLNGELILSVEGANQMIKEIESKRA